jgi:hypothetical protein
MTVANWTSAGAPSRTGNHDLIFGGTLNTTTNANSGGWTIHSLSFDASATGFTLGGGVLNVGAGGVSNQSAHTQTLQNQIKLTTDQTWTAATGALVSNGYFDANNKNLTFTGASAITVAGQFNGVSTLNLTGSGDRTFANAVNNASTVNVAGTGTHTFAGQMNVTTLNVTAGTSTFANVQAGNGGIHIGGTASATFTGPVTGGNGGITINGSGDVVFSGSINSGTLTLNGSGTTTITGSGSKSTGAVVVNSGTLILDQAGGGDAINNSLTVNAGGTVIFTGDNQVPAWQTVTLNEGSTLYLGDTNQTFANLVITGDSVIDFGSGGSELNITYGGITITENITVTIVNWNAAAGDVFAGANPGSPVVNVQYADNEGHVYATGTWGGGYVTPGTPVPEPAAYGLILLGGGIAFVLWRRRKG